VLEEHIRCAGKLLAIQRELIAADNCGAATAQ
jgi:hypothetical protein